VLCDKNILLKLGDSTSYVVWVRVLVVNEGPRKKDEGCTNEDDKVDLRHVRRRSQSALVMRVESITVDGMIRKGRPKLMWEDKLKTDLKELLLCEDMTFDRNSWRTRIRVDEEDA
ncbi:hypothetical protein Tco_0068845, partial [Tanacetum coccineum]